MPRFLAFILCLLAAPALAADIGPLLTLKDHAFTPSELTIPANTAVVLTIVNNDATADEFDSADLNVEKVIPGGKKGIVHLQPLKPGHYAFVGEYHADTAHGTLIAE